MAPPSHITLAGPIAFPFPSTIEDHLRSRTHSARQNLLRKKAEFESIVETTKQGLTDDIEGAKRIRDAGSELSAARVALEKAVYDFNTYLRRAGGAEPG